MTSTSTNVEKLDAVIHELEKLDKRQKEIYKRFPNMMFELDPKEFDRRKLDNHVARLEYREENDKDHLSLLNLVTQLNKIRHDIKKTSELINITPDYNIHVIKELEAKIKAMKKVLPPCKVPYPEVEEFVNYYKYNIALTQYKIIQRDVDAHRIILDKKYKKLRELIYDEEMLKIYKKYAEDNNLEVYDDNFISVCNNHKLQHILDNTTFECTCPEIDRNDWAADHLVNFTDGICSFGSCMYPICTLDLDKSFGFIALNNPTQFIKMKRIELTQDKE